MKNKTKPSFFSLTEILNVFDGGKTPNLYHGKPDSRYFNEYAWAHHIGKVQAGVPIFAKVDASKHGYGTAVSGSFLCRSFEIFNSKVGISMTADYVKAALFGGTYTDNSTGAAKTADKSDREFVTGMTGVVSAEPVTGEAVAKLFAACDTDVFVLEAGDDSVAKNLVTNKAYEIFVARKNGATYAFTNIATLAKFANAKPATVRRWISGKSKPGSKAWVSDVKAVKVKARK